MQGSPSSDDYVETYNVYYTPDSNDELFEPVTIPGTELPKVFPGPENKNIARRVIFDKPFVAQKIKVVPKTWHNKIAVRFEVIGCDNKTEHEAIRFR